MKYLQGECVGCGKCGWVSADSVGALQFYEPACKKCRDRAVRDSEMDDFDRAYARARANGWED